MSHPGGVPPEQPSLPGCTRHPDRPTGLRCNRCGRPYCPACLREAAVGYQCASCVSDGARTIRQARNVAGAPLDSTGGRPVATLSLIALNTLLYLLTAAQSASLVSNFRDSALFESWALVPLYVAAGEYERLIGSGFLHYGPLHLLVNMFVLYIVGREVEAVLGRGRYLAVYAVSLLGGSVAAMWFENALAATVGASGAVYGLFGAIAVILVRLRQNATGIFVIIGINVVISVTIPGISLWGHLGGLVAGAAAAAMLLYVPMLLSRPKGGTAAGRRAGIIALAALAATLVVATLIRVVELRSIILGA
ncbi:rhomboid family intramembrane serine protease [Hoyosella sp. G463]|uniref:Rhomboid family intramembrane serine protease n=1 Tax=Lolliginicoccus lacisalsi TaxID=2742202 RepID=A0A927JE92_9ACTN|nr:rhomboid family intramembrane serine protease [Lolliginicoccus lacisalsi]MBD8507002.1 rhomboid family intramembrane serine protease [Lolliginicoccus lacisalsi]